MLLVVLLFSAQIDSTLAITWDVFYSADTLPDEDPINPWGLVEDFDNDTGVATVSGGILRLDTSSEKHKWSYQQVWSPDNSVGWTVEVRLKIQSSYSQIYFHADGKWPSINFLKDRTQFPIREGPVDEEYVDNTYFRTYRICMKGAELKVYLEGLLFYTGTVELTSPYNYIDFGDVSYTGSYGGVSHWDYVAWKYGYHPHAPQPVGGVWVPVDKFGLLAPYIGLASTIVVATVAAAIYAKRAKRRKEKE